MSWLILLLALAAFAASHYLPARGGLRARLIGLLGRRTYFSLYGLVSVAVLAWLVVAAGRAPHVELWPQMPWMRWAANGAMPLAAILAAAGIGAQPYTLGGRSGGGFDPAAPGLAAVTRHPLLWALAVWAAAHLLVNGDLAHAVLFGAFLVMALGAMPVFDRRAALALEEPARREFFAATSILSLAPLADAGWLRRNLGRLGLRAGIGLGAWLVALALHGPVIGVSPLPV